MVVTLYSKGLFSEISRHGYEPYRNATITKFPWGNEARALTPSLEFNFGGKEVEKRKF